MLKKKSWELLYEALLEEEWERARSRSVMSCVSCDTDSSIDDYSISTYRFSDRDIIRPGEYPTYYNNLAQSGKIRYDSGKALLGNCDLDFYNEPYGLLGVKKFIFSARRAATEGSS